MTDLTNKNDEVIDYGFSGTDIVITIQTEYEDFEVNDFAGISIQENAYALYGSLVLAPAGPASVINKLRSMMRDKTIFSLIQKVTNDAGNSFTLRYTNLMFNDFKYASGVDEVVLDFQFKFIRICD
jgi:hypothetical protein